MFTPQGLMNHRSSDVGIAPWARVGDGQRRAERGENYRSGARGTASRGSAPSPALWSLSLPFERMSATLKKRDAYAIYLLGGLRQETTRRKVTNRPADGSRKGIASDEHGKDRIRSY